MILSPILGLQSIKPRQKSLYDRFFILLTAIINKSVLRIIPFLDRSVHTQTVYCNTEIPGLPDWYNPFRVLSGWLSANICECVPSNTAPLGFGHLIVSLIAIRHPVIPGLCILQELRRFLPALVGV